MFDVDHTADARTLSLDMLRVKKPHKIVGGIHNSTSTNVGGLDNFTSTASHHLFTAERLGQGPTLVNYVIKVRLPTLSHLGQETIRRLTNVCSDICKCALAWHVCYRCSRLCVLLLFW